MRGKTILHCGRKSTARHFGAQVVLVEFEVCLGSLSRCTFCKHEGGACLWRMELCLSLVKVEQIQRRTTCFAVGEADQSQSACECVLRGEDASVGRQIFCEVWTWAKPWICINLIANIEVLQMFTCSHVLHHSLDTSHWSKKLYITWFFKMIAIWIHSGITAV